MDSVIRIVTRGTEQELMLVQVSWSSPVPSFNLEPPFIYLLADKEEGFAWIVAFFVSCKLEVGHWVKSSLKMADAKNVTLFSNQYLNLKT